jgi:hypothetical protein
MLTLLTTLFLAQTCPEGMRCVSEEQMNQIATILKQYKCLQTEAPRIVMDPWVIMVDDQKRVFSGPGIDGNTDIKGVMTWCPFEAKLKVKPEVKLYTKKKPIVSFRFKFKAYVYWKIAFILTPKEMMDGGVGIDFFHIWKFNLQVIFGILSGGGGIGFDITPNFGVVAGVVNPWWYVRPTPIIGVYFGF